MLFCRRYPYIFGELFCQLRGLFAEMSANATVLTITAFTAERYVAICHPFMAQSMSKLSRAVKLIVIIWLVAALFAIPQVRRFFNFEPNVFQLSTDIFEHNANTRVFTKWKLTLICLPLFESKITKNSVQEFTTLLLIKIKYIVMFDKLSFR